MSAPRRTAAGFTLIEILVVLAIVGLLMTFAALGIGRYRETGRITECRTRLAALTLAVESYAERMGDPPPARLAELGVRAGNALNEGIEALVVALRRSEYGGRRPDERWLANLDGDEGEGLAAHDGTRALLELVDPWGRPLAYFVHTAYDEPGLYSEGDGRDGSVADVRAAVSALTGAFHRFESFQLRSAGPDGRFHTEDDLANFEIDIAAGSEP